LRKSARRGEPRGIKRKKLLKSLAGIKNRLNFAELSAVEKRSVEDIEIFAIDKNSTRVIQYAAVGMPGVAESIGLSQFL